MFVFCFFLDASFFLPQVGAKWRAVAAMAHRSNEVARSLQLAGRRGGGGEIWGVHVYFVWIWSAARRRAWLRASERLLYFVATTARKSCYGAGA